MVTNCKRENHLIFLCLFDNNSQASVSVNGSSNSSNVPLWARNPKFYILEKLAQFVLNIPNNIISFVKMVISFIFLTTHTTG
ncbi:unnamed protein product [Schistosoma turkestanicum]|nr:unnamed protein product [Schistosoma turkestanicum]